MVAGVLAVGLALAPAVAVAGGLEDDPTPSDWPTIAAPVDDRGGASDPMPEAQPTVAKPNEGSSNDPQPSDWPTPVQQ
ncbi:hypothetical protein FB561_1583 [Kribbella amoyensis]|uniref:Uncharacterized protein n=1 Tax=Kribbella amoyensis TaxID=996641 RepID=A0A561BNQ5_9ACTN|nr:hypothetical protein FB561_1583 [Kribbella amoyensis]